MDETQNPHSMESVSAEPAGTAGPSLSREPVARVDQDVAVEKPLFAASGESPVPPSYSVPPLVQAATSDEESAPRGSTLSPWRVSWGPFARMGKPSPKVLVMAGLLFGPALVTTLGFFAISAWERWRQPATGVLALGVQEPRLPTVLDQERANPLEDAGNPPSPEDVGPPAPVWRVSALQGDPNVVVSTGVVGKRTFAAALTAVGVGKEDQSRLVKAFSTVRKFDRCHPTDAYTVARETSTGRLLAFELATSPADVYQARRDEMGILQGKRLELRVERHSVAVAFTVGEDLRESVVKAGLDDDMLKMLDDALHGHVELSSLRRGARLRVIASEDRIEGEFGRYAELEAVEYIAPGPSVTPLRVYHFGPATPPNASAPVKLGGYYDAQGRQPYHGGWRSPVPMARLSSRFNPRRKHPVLHIVMPHNGVDFAAPSGTPVYATAPGVIRSAGDGGPCGNMVQIQHPNGLVSAYCHLSRFGGVQPGQHVEGRQLIGYVGQTGRATGPHLHFAIKRGDAFMDPLALKLDGVRVVPPADRTDFARRREDFDSRLDAVALAAPLTDVDGGSNESSDAEVIYELPPEIPGSNP